MEIQSFTLFSQKYQLSVINLKTTTFWVLGWKWLRCTCAESPSSVTLCPSEKLDTLEEWVREIFSKVPNKWVSEEALSHFEEVLSLRRLSLSILSSKYECQTFLLFFSLTWGILFCHHTNPDWLFFSCHSSSLRFMSHRGTFQGVNMHAVVSWKPHKRHVVVVLRAFVSIKRWHVSVLS